MCLNSVAFGGKVPSYYKYEKKTGYKVFRKNGSIITGEHRGLKGTFKRSRLKIGDSYESTTGLISMGLFKSYPAGFHILSRLEDAKRRAGFNRQIVKVSYSEPVCIGFDRGSDIGKTIIARKITLLEEIKQ